MEICFSLSAFLKKNILSVSRLLKFREFLRAPGLAKVRMVRACVVCEELVFLELPLCRGCRRCLYLEFVKHLEQVIFLNIRHRKVPVFYLWSWGEENGFVIQKVIVALKDGGNPKLYGLFAKWMNIKLRHFNVFPRHNVFAVPSLDRSHGLQMGKSFSKELGLRFFDILFKIGSSTQKNRGKQERQEIRMGICKDKIEDLDLDHTGLLVDDVMVTGGSLKACIEALDPAHIQYIAVWAEKQ